MIWFLTALTHDIWFSRLFHQRQGSKWRPFWMAYHQHCFKLELGVGCWTVLWASFKWLLLDFLKAEALIPMFSVDHFVNGWLLFALIQGLGTLLAVLSLNQQAKARRKARRGSSTKTPTTKSSPTPKTTASSPTKRSNSKSPTTRRVS